MHGKRPIETPADLTVARHVVSGESGFLPWQFRDKLPTPSGEVRHLQNLPAYRCSRSPDGTHPVPPPERPEPTHADRTMVGLSIWRSYIRRSPPVGILRPSPRAACPCATRRWGTSLGLSCRANGRRVRPDSWPPRRTTPFARRRPDCRPTSTLPRVGSVCGFRFVRVPGPRYSCERFRPNPQRRSPS